MANPEHPFFEFVDKIGTDPKALEAFLDNPGAFSPHPLTSEQKDALLSANFGVIEPLLRQEFPGVEAEFHRRLRERGLAAQAIGWNMIVLLDNIKSIQSKA
jgi:hypothetical protein